jgi:excinuclease ABC subunit C
LLAADSTTILAVGAVFEFDQRVEFAPENAEEILRRIPAAAGVFALRGERATDEPYLTRAADLRRRLRRLLAPPEAVDERGRPVLSKRLNLRDRVRSIEWTQTGSEFESMLVIYRAMRALFGAEQARKRLRLHAPYFIRVTMTHEHPRAYVTNRLSRRAMPECFGPFPSRAAAERYCDAVLDLFKLRRCYEDLEPYPEHPGCVYGDMKKCLEPCKQKCTPEAYAEETRRVFDFFSTRGASLLNEVATQREAASEAMDFENAAALHKQWEKIRAASLLADELVRPVADLRVLIVQEAAPRLDDERHEEAAVFLLEHGRIVGPERLSTLGVRAVREQTAVGSSLFAQPLMLAPVPLDEAASNSTVSNGTETANSDSTSAIETDPKIATATLSPEDRARVLLQRLQERATAEGKPDIAEVCDYLSLFKRWYYRPEKQRSGDALLPNADGAWPVRRLLNAAARAVLGPPSALPPADREAAKGAKTRLIHAGRPGVERAVAALPKRKQTEREQDSPPKSSDRPGNSCLE